MSGIAVEPLWRPETQQAVFKKVLMAMSYAGCIQDLPEEIAEGRGGTAVLAALVDEACTYADPHGVLATSDAGFLGAPRAEAIEADYLIADVSGIPDFEVKTGTIYRPEASATVILIDAQPSLPDRTWNLRGPGIRDCERLEGGIELERWLEWRRTWIAYPLGIDLILCRGGSVVAVPRTTVLRRAEEDS